KYKKLSEMLGRNFSQNWKTVPLFNAVVKSIQGESCTVDIDGLEIDEVRLKATINGEQNKIIAEPKIDSIVLVGSLTGDLTDLAVLKIDEVAKLLYEQDGLKIEIDSTDGKVKIENNLVSVYDLFQQLVDLLKLFKVYTPAGPSGTPLPDTLMSITAFETDFKKILK
ncbi:MAG: hypothetical protein RL172_2133, partial [Bacteroidota bacterium]